MDRSFYPGPAALLLADGVPAEEVERRARELRPQMRVVGHPFIPVGECVVLSRSGRDATIFAKADSFLQGARPA